mmetsp:Transcript_4327/g.18410  ORF Transcript_4327/g.18410 Transcript_4327/m.18410 type:complete len:201 (-) Transcript_4327:1613-2215(-)
MPIPSSAPSSAAASRGLTCSCAMSKHRPSLSSSTRMRPTPSAAARLTLLIARSKSRGSRRSARATSVVSPTSPVSMERGGGGSVWPEMAASAAATTSTGERASASESRLARIFSAVGVKYGSRSSSTSAISWLACSAEAVITSAPVGGLISRNVTPVSRTMVFTRYCSRGVYIAMALPCLLARPVRPQRCTKDSVSCGSS